MTKATAIAIAKLALQKGYIIDTHNDKQEKMNIDCVLIVEDKESGNFTPCWASKRVSYFSVNPLRKKDDTVFLSTYALGPVMDLRNQTLTQAVENANALYSTPSVNNGFSSYHFEIFEPMPLFDTYEEFNKWFMDENATLTL